LPYCPFAQSAKAVMEKWQGCSGLVLTDFLFCFLGFYIYNHKNKRHQVISYLIPAAAVTINSSSTLGHWEKFSFYKTKAQAQKFKLQK